MPRTPWKEHEPAARVAHVAAGSIAEEVELQPGDLLLAVNEAPLPDYIAYRFAIAQEEIRLTVARGEAVWAIEIEKDPDEDLGITFTSDVFDGVRACRNRCVFCFEAQMPAGMRASLRLRDDDFRLSFLHGNFVTLTNLRPGDMDRIIREHLSPLYVSVHATDPGARRAMFGVTRLPDLHAQLRALGEGGIALHTQIVLCPGWNDGAVLARTLDDLAALEALASIGIVPVGLTAHRPGGPAVRPVTPADARAVLEEVARRQSGHLATRGACLVYAADEFYLLAGDPFPPAEAYEGFPQIENGIGLARVFLDELAPLEWPRLPARRLTLATGALAAPLLETFAAALRAHGVIADVIPIPNRFYGGGVTVAGLLTGRDLLDALTGRDLGDLLLLPAAMRNADNIFLDDLTPADIERTLHTPLRFAASPRDVLAILAGMV